MGVLLSSINRIVNIHNLDHCTISTTNNNAEVVKARFHNSLLHCSLSMFFTLLA